MALAAVRVDRHRGDPARVDGRGADASGRVVELRRLSRDMRDDGAEGVPASAPGRECRLVVGAGVEGALRRRARQALEGSAALECQPVADVAARIRAILDQLTRRGSRALARCLAAQVAGRVLVLALGQSLLALLVGLHAPGPLVLESDVLRQGLLRAVLGFASRQRDRYRGDDPPEDQQPQYQLPP